VVRSAVVPGSAYGLRLAVCDPDRPRLVAPAGERAALPSVSAAQRETSAAVSVRASGNQRIRHMCQQRQVTLHDRIRRLAGHRPGLAQKRVADLEGDGEVG